MTPPPQQQQQPALLISSSNSSDSNIKQVVVHPLVLLSVLDHHTRRAEKEGRVIGTLLGRRDGSMIEVTNCFAVPHAERGDEVAIGKDFNKQMLHLHLRGNKKEVVVGWYATAAASNDTIADTSSLIHEFYSTEVDDGDPIHMTVDTRLLQDQLNVCAYTSVPVVVQGEVLANLFHQVPLKMESSQHETICLDQMAHHGGSTTRNQQQNHDTTTTALQVSMEHLLELLENASNYVDSVVSGKTPPNSQIGRLIADTLHSVPRIQPAVFDKLYQDSLQDLLMVTYLSNITKTQLTIAEKLNASLGAV